MTEATAVDETGESGISQMDLFGEVSLVFVDNPVFAERTGVQASVRRTPAGSATPGYGFTDEERRFVLGLQDTLIAERKFFESLFTDDVGTPYTVRELLANGHRADVQEYLIGRYLFNNGIGDEHGVLPVEGEVRRYFSKKTGGPPEQINFTYRRAEEYCRDSRFSDSLTLEILGKTSRLFGNNPGFYA